MHEIVKTILKANLLKISHVELTKMCRNLITDGKGNGLSLRQAYIVATIIKELVKH